MEEGIQEGKARPQTVTTDNIELGEPMTWDKAAFCVHMIDQYSI